MAIERKVQKNSNGQYTLTIPKILAETLSFEKGIRVSFSIGSDGQLILSKK